MESSQSWAEKAAEHCAFFPTWHQMLYIMLNIPLLAHCLHGIILQQLSHKQLFLNKTF